MKVIIALIIIIIVIIIIRININYMTEKFNVSVHRTKCKINLKKTDRRGMWRPLYIGGFS